MPKASSRKWLVTSSAEPIKFQKQSAEKFKYVLDVTPYLAGLAKTLSSATATVTAGTGTAPTVGVAPVVSGSQITFRIDGGVAPVYNASGVIQNSGTAWNGGGLTPGVGDITVVFTFSDATTLTVHISFTLFDPA